ncbi:MAG: DUF417 family protein [Acetobacteraceae bacterium]
MKPGAGACIETVGSAVTRCGLALIFPWFGAMKFTSYEASGIEQLVAHSPLVGWWPALLGLRGTSDMLGVFESATGVLLLAGLLVMSAIGGAMGVVTFLTTLSFCLTTPGVGELLAGGFPAISGDVGHFLLKDAALLGISIWLAGEALVATRFSPALGQGAGHFVRP